MLKYFFELPLDGRSRGALFDGLRILEAGEAYTKEQGQYPVVFLTLKSAKQSSFDLAHSCLTEAIAREYRRHSVILNGPSNSGLE